MDRFDYGRILNFEARHRLPYSVRRSGFQTRPRYGVYRNTLYSCGRDVCNRSDFGESFNETTIARKYIVPTTPVTGYIFSTSFEKPNPDNDTKTSVTIIFFIALVFPFITEKDVYTDETRDVKIEKIIIISKIIEQIMFFETTFTKGISPLLSLIHDEIAKMQIVKKTETQTETRHLFLRVNSLVESIIILDDKRQFTPAYNTGKYIPLKPSGLIGT